MEQIYYIPSDSLNQYLYEETLLRQGGWNDLHLVPPYAYKATRKVLKRFIREIEAPEITITDNDELFDKYMNSDFRASLAGYNSLTGNVNDKATI